MTGQNVTINDLTLITTPASTNRLPVMAAAGTDTNSITLLQVQNFVGIYTGSGVPTATTVTHPSIYLRSDGSSANTRAYISTSTGGWVAFTTAS